MTLWSSIWRPVKWLWSRSDIDVKSLGPFSSIFVTSHCDYLNHRVTSMWKMWHLWQFFIGSGDQIFSNSIRLVPVLWRLWRVTTVDRVAWADFTRMQSGKLGSTFFITIICSRFVTFVMTLHRVGWPDYTQVQSQNFRYIFFVVVADLWYL